MYGFHATSLDFLQTVKNADPNADWKPFTIPMEKSGEKAAPVMIASTPDKNQATTKAIAEQLRTGEPGELTGEQYTMWEYCYKALQGDDSMWGWLGVFGEEGGQSILLKYQDPEQTLPVYNKFVSAPGKQVTGL